MADSKKPNRIKELLEQKKRTQKSAGGVGIIGNSEISNKFRPGEKLQPKIRRGGRNSSGKP